MTPQDFIKKWKPVALNERQTAQEHFIDLCRVFGHPTPAEADPSGESFSFEKGVPKSGGGDGFADVWKNGFFAWEYKKKKRDLDAALGQLVKYASALGNPPLHVVCDTVRFKIVTAWTNTIVKVYAFELEDLAEPHNLAILHALFHNPDALKPNETRESLTNKAAKKFQAISDRLQQRNPNREAVAHFVNQLVFCFFANSVKLLPEGVLRRLLDLCKRRPHRSGEYFSKLFAAMASAGGELDLTDIPHFNGGLFDGRAALELNDGEIEILFDAAGNRLDWSLIDPSIFGTLFERFLDPDKRAQIGAHYTDTRKIMLIVEPVIVRPLLAEWVVVKAGIAAILQPFLAEPEGVRDFARKRTAARENAAALRDAFIARLAKLRILDPACGSGNFLYLALQAVKDIEYQVITACELMDLGRPAFRVGPEILRGLEINPLAAELARMTIWIGDIQWGLQHGIFVRPEPILRDLQTIECRDALLTRSLPAKSPEIARLSPSPPAGEGARRADEGFVPPAKKLALKQFARTMRAQATPAEEALWKLLRDRRFDGCKFRRQVPIGDYIADFACFSHRLIVEADGSQHGISSGDPVRDAWFVSQGFRVRRFWNSEILRERQSVMDTLWADLSEANPSSALRAPSPARGEGANAHDTALSPSSAEKEAASPDLAEQSPSPPAFERARRADEGCSSYFEAEWPEADFIIGNPPFLGGKKLRNGRPATFKTVSGKRKLVSPAMPGLGDEYVDELFRVYGGLVAAESDLVCYWFYKAWAAVQAGRAVSAGLVATNSIRGGANRRVLEPIAAKGGIFEAWSDEGWTVEGAAVRVSVVCVSRTEEMKRINGSKVDQVNSDLTATVSDLTKVSRLTENAQICIEGMKKYGPFDIAGDLARDILKQPINVNGLPNSSVIRPWLNAMDLVRRSSDTWVIDFNGKKLEQATLFEVPFEHVLKHVLPVRQTDRAKRTRENWWTFERDRPALRKTLATMKRFIATPVVAKYRLFVWLDPICYIANLADAIARDDDTTFGILHSRFHEAWSLRLGTWLGVGNDPRYTPTTTFETFPFPENLTPNLPAATYASDPRAQKIAAAAKRLDDLRKAWLNPPDLVDIVPEIIPTAAPGEAPVKYPDRILPKNAEAAAKLKLRTLTNLYNQRPQWLADAHAALDRAVAAAYGWPDDIATEAALEKLLALNLQRAAGQ